MSNAIEQIEGFAACLLDIYLLDAFRSSVASRTVGSELNGGEFTADEQAAMLASQLSKITFAIIGEGILFYAAKANLDLEKFARNLPNGYDEAIQLATDKWNKIHLLQEINSQLEKNFGESKKLLMAQKNEVIKSLSVINDGIKSLAQNYPDLGINLNDDPKTIFDKVIGHTEVSKNVFDLAGRIFNYTEFIRMSVQEVNTADSENVSNYTMNWMTYSSQLIGPAKRFIENGTKSELLSKIPVLSAKNLVGIATRGVLSGILTDTSYKVGYALGEWIWNDLFKLLYDGQTAYDIYAYDFQVLYSTIFSHLTADKLNAVIVFNTLLLGNFVNAQGKSVIMEDTVALFGSDDYKEMDFDKALKNYKAIYKAITGKNDAEGISNEFAMLNHMESSYQEFRALKGQKLIIAQDGTDINEFGKLALENSDDALAYRYALANLNSFVLADADYTKHNQNGELNLYSKQNPNGLTQIYLEKRAKMLAVMLNQINGTFQTDDYSYQDLGSGILINQTSLDTNHGNIDVYKDNTQIIFGSKNNDTIKAKDIGDKNNFLFGGGGNDTLIGNEGNDYLEGGSDFDTYHIKDNDTLFDSDGKGAIYFDGKALPKDFIKRNGSDDIWEAKGSGQTVLFIANKQGNDLVIRSNTGGDSDDSVTIKNFFTTATITGTNNTVYSALSITLADNQQDADQYGVHTLKTNDTLRATVHTNTFTSQYLNVIGSDKVDFINGGGGKKRLEVDTAGGNDTIYGGDGHDILKGGSGNDVIFGSSVFYDFEPKGSPRLPKPTTDAQGNVVGVDKDLIIGGEGNDLISAGIGDDIIWADDEYQPSTKPTSYRYDLDSNNPHNKSNTDPKAKGDWILGGRGNDFIHGSTNNDFLQGGADSDIIYGGGGNDVILGDGHIRFGIKNQVLRSDNQILSMEYNYDQATNKEQAIRRQTANLQDYKTFTWNIDINHDNNDYILTKQEGIALANDFHVLEAIYQDNTNDWLYGGNGNDLIIGQYGDDYLDGGDGDDILWGDDNRDTSISGNDTLVGGTGNDTLIGGLGDDKYVFTLTDLATANDNKIIKDLDNQGKIVINNQTLTGMEFFKLLEHSNIYTTHDGKYTLAKHKDSYTLTGTEFNASIAIKDTPNQNGTLLGMIFAEEIKNTAPILQNPIKSQVLKAGQDISLDLRGTFSDAEEADEQLIYAIQGIEGTGLHFDPHTKHLTGKLPEQGTLNFQLSATDSQGLTANTNFTLTINEHPTLVTSLALPATLAQDEHIDPIDITSLFQDNDGDRLTYTLTTHQANDPMSHTQGITLNDGKLIIDPKQVSVGTHNVGIVATDALGQTVSTTAHLTITEAKPNPPTVTPVPPNPINPTNPIINDDPTLVGKSFVGKHTHDTLTGDDKANILRGLGGNDALYGGKGNDTLYGGDGHDVLVGGEHNDILIGGLGNDTYHYAKGDGLDTIKDDGGHDVLKITGLTLSELGFIRQGDHLFIDTNLQDNAQQEGIMIEHYFNPKVNVFTHLANKIPSTKKTITIEEIHVDGNIFTHEKISQMTNAISAHLPSNQSMHNASTIYANINTATHNLIQAMSMTNATNDVNANGINMNNTHLNYLTHMQGGFGAGLP